MKKLIPFLLAAIVILQLPAQSQGRFPINPPGNLPININLYVDGFFLKIELSRSSQLDSIKNIDSILHKAWADLQPVKDSFNKPFVSRTVDYSSWAGGASSFKIREHPSNGNSYQNKNGEVKQIKGGWDTLRIRFDTFYPTKNNLKGKGPATTYSVFYLTFVLPKIENIVTIRPGALDSALDMIRITARTGTKIKDFKYASISYDGSTHKWSKPYFNWTEDKKLHVEPDFNIGFQYVRGQWATSFAGGVQFISGDYFGERNVFKLLWEPHFFFSRDSSNSVLTDRNDFITFRFTQYEKDEPDDLFFFSFSLGYLVRKKGNWYEKNTFKLSVPGMRYKSLSLQPEFFFNDFFKHFSPSLKLNFNID